MLFKSSCNLFTAFNRLEGDLGIVGNKVVLGMDNGVRKIINVNRQKSRRTLRYDRGEKKEF